MKAATWTAKAEPLAQVKKPRSLEAFAKMVIGEALSLRYKIDAQGLENIPKTGAAILTPNHVSFIDALAIAKKCDRPIRFVIGKSIYDNPVLHALLKPMGVIPIAGHADPEAMGKGFDEISKALKGGELVCIFPEGKLTRDGEVGVFRSGISKILERDPVPVIPVGLGGLWGSVFTQKSDEGLLSVAKSLFARREVKIDAGAAVAPEQADPSTLRSLVVKLRGPVP